MFKGILILITVVLIFSYCGKKEDIISEVGSLSIIKSEFINELQNLNPKSKNIADKKKFVLDNLILKKLKINAALNLDLQEKDEYLLLIEDYKRELIGKTYFEKIILSPLVSQKDIDEFLERRGFEMKATHIQIKHNESIYPAKRTRLQSRDIALDIYIKLKKGADFTELVGKYSEDGTTKSNKGDLGYFTWGRMVAPFQQAAWDLKVGEISGPVETAYGFHIIRLDDKRKILNYKPDTTAENISRIRNKLYKSMRDTIKIISDSQINRLKKKYGYELENESIKMLSEMISKKIKNKKVTYDDFTDNEKNMVLASWSGGHIRFKMLIELYNDDSKQILIRFRDINNLENAIELRSRQDLFAAEALDIGLNKNLKIINMIQKFEEAELVNFIEKIEIVDKVVISNDQIEQYYKENKNRFSTHNKDVEPLESVKEEIISLLRSRQIGKMKLIWEKELKNKYTIKIDEKKLAEIEL